MDTRVGLGHGKVILLGEHSVVYGRPAIAAGLARGCTAEAEASDVDTLLVEPWGVRVQADRAEEDPERELLRRGFATLCDRHPNRAPFLVRAHMQIPGGAGLGGSAALSVAILRALDIHLARSSTPEMLIEGSLAWENVFHGNASGIDSAMATRGGLALYRRGEGLAEIRTRRALSLVVAHSGEHGSTKAMVASVARQHARDRDKAEQIFDAIAALVQNAKSALEDGDHARLGQLMDLNQTLLNTLMLSTSKLETMCATARDAGAFGAKLTGGGGGGCMIALAADRAAAQSISAALSADGDESFVVEVTP
ncbi:MAG TPA: mevalonate kinase [Polyangiales bacterium]|nr:mevalonate kinase [Polyangiales bacterium]